MLLLHNLTYRNSDADTANVEKSITQGYIQCRDLTTVASSKTEMVHVEKLTTKVGQYAFYLQTIGAENLLKWSIWGGDPNTKGGEPGCPRKFMQSSNTILYTILCPGYIKIISISAPISKYYLSIKDVYWWISSPIILEGANGSIKPSFWSCLLLVLYLFFCCCFSTSSFFLFHVHHSKKYFQ